MPEEKKQNPFRRIRIRYRGRFSQIQIYLGKLLRMFLYQSDWKVLPMSAMVAGLVGLVIRRRFFTTMEGTLMSALAVTCLCLWNGCFNSIQVICRERQKQRLSIAGILAMEPKRIIMDEPTAMLDPGGRREVMKAIKDLLAENLSVVLITHYMEEAVEADYIYVMDQGHVVMAGTPVEIFSDIDTIRRYGLEPPQVVQVVDLLNSKGIKLDRSILTTEELIKALCQR